MSSDRNKSGSPRKNRPSSRPALSLVDSRRRREQLARRQLQRLAPLAAVALLVATFLTCGFFALNRLGYLEAASGYASGLEAFTLRALILHGAIPLITASLMVVLYRPPLELIAGAGTPPAVILASPAAGFFAGWLIWCAVRLTLSFFPVSGRWLAIPELWQAGALYLGRSPLAAVLTVLAAVLVPATSHEFLYRGMIQPAFSTGDPRFSRALLPALVAAGLSLDLPGLAVLLTGSLLASWARAASGTLTAPSLLSAGYAGAMLAAPPLFSWISEAVFRSPLIDPPRVRAFLVTLMAVSVILLLAPLALIGGSARRREPAGSRGQHEARIPFRRINRVTALLCLAAAALCLYFSR